MKYKLESDTGKEILERVFSSDIELFKKYLNEIRGFGFPELDGLHWTKWLYADGSKNSEIRLRYWIKGLIELVNSNDRLIQMKFDENGYSINKDQQKCNEDIYFCSYNIVDDNEKSPVIKGKIIEIAFFWENCVVSIKGKTMEKANSENKKIYAYEMSVYTNVSKQCFHLPEIGNILEPEYVYKCNEEKYEALYDSSPLSWLCKEGNGPSIISTEKFENPYELRLLADKAMNKLNNAINRFKR